MSLVKLNRTNRLFYTQDPTESHGKTYLRLSGTTRTCFSARSLSQSIIKGLLVGKVEFVGSNDDWLRRDRALLVPLSLHHDRTVLDETFPPLGGFARHKVPGRNDPLVGFEGRPVELVRLLNPVDAHQPVLARVRLLQVGQLEIFVPDDGVPGAVVPGWTSASYKGKDESFLCRSAGHLAEGITAIFVNGLLV